jgi:predicted glycosyltransferase
LDADISAASILPSDSGEPALRTSDMTAIALYWHNGRSLGHTSESIALARELLRQDQEVTVLGITGAVHGLTELPSGFDHVKLPSIDMSEVAARVEYRPRLRLALPDLIRLRSELIQHTVETLDPDIFVVNHIATGLRRELRQVLDSRQGRNVLTLRGILFDPAATAKDYFDPEPASWIERHYASIHVHTDPAIVRIEKLYDIPPVLRERLYYTGYLADPYPGGRVAAREALGIDSSERFLLASMGGGEGAIELWRAISEAAHRQGDAFDRIHFVTGPYLNATSYAEVAELAQRAGARVVRYEPRLEMFAAASDVFLAAAGANMIGEILANRANAILISRQVHESEQRLHAQILRDLGYVRTLDRTEVTADRMSRALSDAICDPRIAPGTILTGGARRGARHLLNLLTALR